VGDLHLLFFASFLAHSVPGQSEAKKHVCVGDSFRRKQAFMPLLTVG
jgi:hypothetical protein